MQDTEVFWGWLNADILNELYHYLLRAQGIEKERIYMPVKKDTLFWLLKGAGYVAVKISDFWDQRLMKYGELVKADKICFQNGYRKNAPVIEVQLKRIEMTETHYIFVLGETLFSNPLANDIAADIVFDMITRSIDAENAAENAVNT